MKKCEHDTVTEQGHYFEDLYTFVERVKCEDCGMKGVYIYTKTGEEWYD